MATTTAVSTTVSIDEYLNKSYRPDVEFIDGALKERPAVTCAHGRLQSLISIWFGKHEDEWQVVVAVDVRTRVSPTRVRLPDVMIDHIGQKASKLTSPPLIVIEILSPDDTYAETQCPAQDYQEMGVPNIWLIEPETRTGRVCQGKQLDRFEAVRGCGERDLHGTRRVICPLGQGPVCSAARSSAPSIYRA